MGSSMINIGSRVVVNKNKQTTNGMLYKGTKVRVLVQTDKNIQVSDAAGRLFWIKLTDISV